MKDWKKIASAQGLNIPDADLERVAPPLETLEAAFRPLVKTIPHDVEPAVTFTIPPEDGQ